ncbi:MAG TPA: DNA glycosylase [Methanoregulaceae archaeon]|nr:DNA glycosylase [Methanoregulaceae archaeon]
MKTITLPPDQPFDLHLTLSCGQVFRWVRDCDWWTGVVGDTVVRIRQDGNRLTFSGADRPFIREYFHLDGDLPAILAGIDRDTLMHETIRKNRGLRIIRQPPWECLASYICATYANIPGIKKRISLLSEKFGEQVSSGSETYYSFPTPDSLAECLPGDLRSCSVGYRASFLADTARIVADSPGWEESVRELSFNDARRVLLSLKGVGKKVADCVLLFGFQRYESFPVDVWIERIMKHCYGSGRELKRYEEIAGLGRELFGAYAGYAQEYLFCDRERIMTGC